MNRKILFALLGGALACGAHAADEPAAPAAATQSIEEIVVTGVRASEQMSVTLKRDAVAIQDSIAAEDIGKLPDATISDSLQRITGVQVDREGGEGTAVNIRGLPQVGTLLNGETFLTAGSIVGAQPDFGDIPSQLFAGADVIKSSSANLLNSGITGTINLRTRRPLEMQEGWTLAGAANLSRGKTTRKNDPEVDGLAAFRSSRWGMLVSAAYSDLELENSVSGMDQYGGELLGEASDSASATEGFLNAFGSAPLPGGIKLLHPSQCPKVDGVYTPSTDNGCDVDVNGDGVANATYLFSPNFSVLERRLERKRLGLNASIQVEPADGYNLIADFFYTDQHRHDRTSGYQLNTATWNGATFLPISARDTGVQVRNGFNDGEGSQGEFYTTQRYQDYLGDFEAYAENHEERSISRNLNLELKFDRGGMFHGSLRAVGASATQLHLQSYAQFSASDGTLWPNEPREAAPDGSMVYPDGVRVFNPRGFAPNTVPVGVDMSGDHLSLDMPQSLRSILGSRDGYALNTITSENDYDRRATMQVLRADGGLRFEDRRISIDFGLRHGRRVASNTSFVLVAPVYGGNGAYNEVIDPASGLPTGAMVPNLTGCYVRYKSIDVLLDGGGVPGACMAGDPVTGFYRAGPYAALPVSRLPAILDNGFHAVNDLAGVNGVHIFDLDPRVMDNVMAFQNALYPGEVRSVDPGGTWRVEARQLSGYVQGNFEGELLFPFMANAGARLVRTQLLIDQHRSGEQGPYFVNPDDLGIERTHNDFTDVLPAANLTVKLRNNLLVRLAYSKNMQLLDLDQWGGGLVLNYGNVAGSSPPIFAVLGGTQNGNPNLRPWRSTNYDVSLEYYFGRSSMLSLAAFHVDVASFVVNGGTLRCDLPDLDGTVRNRCVAINGPIQGSGKSLGGLEFGYKQALDFLPGFLRNMGVDANFTYSPSNVGTDVAGHSIPFPDNSKEQGNLVLWYQGGGLQVRVAANYRSKRAVSQDFSGISGFEVYQAPTTYLDASLGYDFGSHLQVILEGSNLTNEREHYYLVWPDQKLNTTRFEPRFTLGIRGKL